ncbi:MAG TPA: PEP-CTERM sorting domain-containing protein [Verrucomicrobiota bacterium]|nr:hypothetical protein [Verrucomicrobiales bacterium]HRI13293.1 PEP-CTERM sorting domain-containing protein [Verrucomicrobiota bacterium]
MIRYRTIGLGPKPQSRFSLLGPLAVALVFPASADTLPVANFSFETPVVVPPIQTLPLIDNWTKSGPDNASGVFPNPAPEAPDHIVSGLEGNQAAFFLAVPGTAISQQLTSQFQAGLEYTLYFAMAGSGPIGSGEGLFVELFYVDNGASVPVATKFAAPLSRPVITSLLEYQTDTVLIPAGSDAVGKDINIRIAVQTVAASAAYWDFDNVRLVTTVPEPGTWALFSVGLTGLILAIQRTKYRP